MCLLFFVFTDTATTEIYTLSLHDALPIYRASAVGAESVHRDPVAEFFECHRERRGGTALVFVDGQAVAIGVGSRSRSEEHTSELQSRRDLVCRLLLEKKKKR